MNITKIRRGKRSRAGLIAAAAATAAASAALLVPLSHAASAQTASPVKLTAPAAPVAHHTVKPTIVLVHGAWASTSAWDGVIARLRALGYTVYAPSNTLMGLPYDANYLRDFLNTISGPIVLVGHSYGGVVVTNAATGDKQVKALVYDDAFIPAKGETAGQLVSAKPGSCVVVKDPTTIFKLVPYPGAPAGAADAYLKQSVFPGCVANGLPAGEQQELAVTQLPLTTAALAEKSGTPAWKTIPSWAIIGTADHTIPPAELLFMAKRAHAHITVIPGAPHVSMISNPGQVTAVILRAVHATS
ncbi:MAG TPA: alpha/beta hydrolase [Trebonia sp.]